MYKGGSGGGGNFFCEGKGVTKNCTPKIWKLYCKIKGSIWFISFFLLKVALLSWAFWQSWSIRTSHQNIFFWYFKTYWINMEFFAFSLFSSYGPLKPTKYKTFIKIKFIMDILRSTQALRFFFGLGRPCSC